MGLNVVTSGGNINVVTNESGLSVNANLRQYALIPLGWDAMVEAYGRGYDYNGLTGVEVIYRTGDDTSIKNTTIAPILEANKLKVRNSLVDFYTLQNKNEFGNYLRFTDSEGLADYGATGGALLDYMIDNFTGLGWRLVAPNNISWDDAIDYAISATINGFTGWFVPNVQQMFGVRDADSPKTIQPPFQPLTNGHKMFTSTAGRGSSGAGQKNSVSWRTSVIDSFSVGTPVAASNSWYFYCRVHY